MRLSELPAEAIEKIKQYRWDRIIEKHEGPETWRSVLQYGVPDFLSINGYEVLLPVERTQHANITILRSIVSDTAQTLTLFLKDVTYVDDPRDEGLFAGFVAVCDRVPGEEFFVAVVYHEWFVIQDNPAFSERT